MLETMQTTHPMFFRRQFSSCARLIATLCLAVAGLSAQAGPIRYQPVVDQVEPRALDCDVAVYGGTPAGVTAAVQAARLGKSAGVLADGVTVSYDATVIRVHNSGRTAVMKGIASNGTVLFALGIEGNDQTLSTGRLVSYATDFTPNITSGISPAATPLGASALFVKGTTDYNDGLMETIRLELTTTSFDVYINGALASAVGGIDYFAAAGDINRLNFQSDNAGGAWYDNLYVVSPPAPASTPGTVVYGR
jgi:hypothetical protein